MTKKELLKSGVKLVVSFGVGTIVTNAVSFTTPAVAMGLLRRAAISVGSFAMSMMVSDRVTDYTDEKLDEAIDEAKKFMDESKEDKKEDPA